MTVVHNEHDRILRPPGRRPDFNAQDHVRIMAYGLRVSFGTFCMT